MDPLEREFRGRLMRLYQECCGRGYRPHRFLQMLTERADAFDVARILLVSEGAQEGFYQVAYHHHRPDLTVEWVVANEPQWARRFTQEQINRARERLASVAPAGR